MAKEYDPKELEAKWQKEWEKSRIYQAEDGSKKPKYYTLIEFPFPSGDGLHTGHVRSYVALDVVSRKRRREGFNVMYPIGWDAFGLPTENYAIKVGKDPRVVTKENSDNFRKQLKSLGISFDWSREINTTDPRYYKWTQWIFLKFLEKGLAYKARIPINWCPKDKIGLANEEVIDGKCERCGTEVEQREREQWMLAITKYVDRLIDGLERVDYPERVKAQQKNWIGRSHGALIKFDDLEVFTTRPDTIFGATFVTIPGKQDKFTGKYVTNPATKEKIPVWEAEYVMEGVGTSVVMGVPAHDERDFEFAKKHDLPIKEVIIPRLPDEKNPHVPGKEVVFRNAVIAVVRNPKTGKYLCLKWKKHPWVTFVMGGIEDGEDAVDSAKREIQEETGYKNLRFIEDLGSAQSEFFAAHKGVNRIAHTRNLLFELQDEEQDAISAEEAAIHEIEWRSEEEIRKPDMTHSEMSLILSGLAGEKKVFTGEGVLFNSGEFTRMSSEEAREKITKKFGQPKTTYKLRDWVFSRQRYWGEPIPVVHCEKCGIVPVPEKDLPVELPKVDNYKPTETGESPLANIEEWVNTDCPKCGGPAKRETDVMPNWAGSSWYYLRYADPENDKEFASEKNLKYWTPVDWYNGGMEHTTLHLLYSRFWHKFLFDLDLVPTDEPYKKRTSHGLVLAEGGVKMSKSLGNVVNPDDIVERFGADTLRLYEMFMGPFEQAIAWSEDALLGPRRFLEKVWRLSGKIGGEIGEEALLHQTIKKVSEDIEAMKFNTAVSTLMVFANALDKQEKISKEEYKTLLLLLAPFAPHVAEELWAILGHKNSVHLEAWPTYDPKKVETDEVSIAVQVDGKVRAALKVSRGESEEAVRAAALALPDVQKWLSGKEPKKVIIVPGKVISIVT